MMNSAGPALRWDELAGPGAPGEEPLQCRAHPTMAGVRGGGGSKRSVNQMAMIICSFFGGATGTKVAKNDRRTVPPACGDKGFQSRCWKTCWTVPEPPRR